MTQPTNAFDVYDAGGPALTGESNREDLSDIIYNIAPTETPFLMMAKRGTARNAKHEWLTDTLADAASNFQIEGDDYVGETRDRPERLYSYTQISAKALTVTGTQEVVNKAGRKSEIAYQLALQAKELKRDMERHIVGFATTADATGIAGDTAVGSTYPNSVGTASAERTTASVGTWYGDLLTMNVDFNGGTDPAGLSTSVNQPDDGAVRLHGTARALLEGTLKNVIRKCWNAGGDPSVILVDGFNKQVISAFTGGATRFDRSEDKRLVTSIDVYVSDFGQHRVVPDRFLVQPDAAPAGVSAYILDMNYWGISYLRPFMQTPLSKTGDSEKRLLLTEWSLCAHQPKASGIIGDLTFS